MTQRSPWLKQAHRIQAAITLLVLVTLLALNLTGAITAGTAVLLFIAIELPLLIVFTISTLLRFRRREGATTPPILDRLETEEPLLRPAVSELRAFQSLGLAIAGRRRTPGGSAPFGYTKGTMTFPLVMVALSLVELVIVHVLVPWLWLKLVLLVPTAWGVLFILGLFASRIVHPHFILNGRLTLRWGRQTVLVAPLSRIASVTAHTNHAHTQPHAEGERLVLTQFQSTNVRIRFTEPIPAAAPVAKRQLPPDFHTLEVQLYVDDPEGLLHALDPQPEETIGWADRDPQKRR